MLRDLLLEQETNTLRNTVSQPSLQLALDRNSTEPLMLTFLEQLEAFGNASNTIVLHFMANVASRISDKKNSLRLSSIVEASLFLISSLMPRDLFVHGKELS